MMRAVDVAGLLGVSRERVRQIANADPTLPQLVETKPRRWDGAEIEVWADEHWCTDPGVSPLPSRVTVECSCEPACLR